jgi:HEAT repeat protein
MKKNKKVKLILELRVIVFCLFCFLLTSNHVWAKECSGSQINAYIKKLNNTNEWIFTIAALRNCGSPAVDTLAANLRAQNEEVRIDAASALASMGLEAQRATPALTTALKDTNSIVRSSAATALGSMGTKAKVALPALTVALQDDDKSVRSVVATAIGSMGIEARAVIPTLTLALQDKDKSVSSTAAYALGRIAADFQYHADSLSSSELKKVIYELEKASKLIENQNNSNTTETALLHQSLKLLKAEQDGRWLERASRWIFQHKLIAIAGIYLLWLISLWSLILWLRPVWILHINNVLRNTRITLPGSLGKYEVPVRSVFLVSFLEQHPRVVNAWINTQIASRQQFEKKEIPLDSPSSVVLSAQFEPSTVQKYAKAIAWECLKQTYQPTSVKRSHVLATITTLNGRNAAEAYLQYLEKLGMLQTVGKAQEAICFTQDILAEYLASLYLVELCGDNEVNWRKFLAQVDAIPNKQAIKSFLLTVRDCSLALQASTGIPSFVPGEIAKRIGLATNVTGQVQSM